MASWRRRLLDLLLLAVMAACSKPSAKPAAEETSEAKPLIVRGQRVYVSNEDSNEISIIDSATQAVVKTIFVGKRPRGIRLAPDGKTLYVALSGSPRAPPNARDAAPPTPDRKADGIAAVDVATLAILRNLPSGQDPESFDLTPDGKLMYVSNEESAQASLLDLSAWKVVQTIPLDEEPEGVTMKPAGDVVYVTSEAANKVFAIDTKTNKVIATIETGPRPRGVVFTPDGVLGYITEEQGASITVVDAKEHKPRTQIKLENAAARPMGAVVAPDGKTVYVSTGRGSAVVYIDTADQKVIKVVDNVGVRPWGIGITPDGKTLYTANGPSNDVSVIDVASGRIVTRIKVGSLPWGIAVSR